MSREVLFVDDDTTTRELMKLMLEKVGYTVALANNGVEALKILEKRHYPLVITDWEMPEMDGAELCRLIRRQHLGGYVYTILLTCRNARENLLEGLEGGADDYLTKPVDQDELLARLQTGKRITHLEHRLRIANQEAMRQTIIDPLTKIYNRRYLMEALGKELERARHEGSPLSVIMCGVDHLNKVNDLYGHQAGDVVLRRVAEILQSSCRSKIDWVARYDEEEFVVVLPATSLDGARDVAERMRCNLESTYIETEHYGLSVTGSFGVATDQRQRPTPTLESDRFLACASGFLYESRNHGHPQAAYFDGSAQRSHTESEPETTKGLQLVA